MSGALPARLSADGRTATWNPGLSRSARVVLRVRQADGTLGERTAGNSGRARVREGERIEAVLSLDSAPPLDEGPVDGCGDLTRG